MQPASASRASNALPWSCVAEELNTCHSSMQPASAGFSKRILTLCNETASSSISSRATEGRQCKADAADAAPRISWLVPTRAASRQLHWVSWGGYPRHDTVALGLAWTTRQRC